MSGNKDDLVWTLIWVVMAAVMIITVGIFVFYIRCYYNPWAAEMAREYEEMIAAKKVEEEQKSRKKKKKKQKQKNKPTDEVEPVGDESSDEEAVGTNLHLTGPSRSTLESLESDPRGVFTSLSIGSGEGNDEA